MFEAPNISKVSRIPTKKTHPQPWNSTVDNKISGAEEPTTESGHAGHDLGIGRIGTCLDDILVCWYMYVYVYIYY